MNIDIWVLRLDPTDDSNVYMYVSMYMYTYRYRHIYS